MQFRLINKTINDKYNREAWQKYYYVNNNIIQKKYRLGYFIRPKRRH